MRDQRLADLLAGTGQDIHHAVGDARLAADLAQKDRGDRGGAGRFEDQGVPAASAGASFQAAISSGKFQGTIWAQTPTGSRRV